MDDLNGICSINEHDCKYYHLNKQLLSMQLKKYELKKQYLSSSSLFNLFKWYLINSDFF